MRELLLELMEFVIELSVVTAWVTVLAIGLSIALLYPTGLYKVRGFAVGIPIIFAIAFGAAGLTDYTSWRQWAYYTLLPLILSPLFVSGFFRKRLQRSKS